VCLCVCSKKKGTSSCAVRLQIFPPMNSNLTANDFMAAIWEQFNANSGNSSSSSLSLSGVASYQTCKLLYISIYTTLLLYIFISLAYYDHFVF
jgi:hypothetical protein